MNANKQQHQSPKDEPLQQIVEVFRTMQLEEEAERLRLQELGGFIGWTQPQDYYAIEISGTVDFTD